MSMATIGAAIAGPLIGAAIGGVSGSGTQQGGTTTVNKDPWLPAQDWMKSNLSQGQGLQNYYQQNPFNQQQQSGYANLASGADYMNRLTPGLLQQLSQPQAFDRNNPRAMPSPLNFSAPSMQSQGAPMNNTAGMGGGLFGMFGHGDVGGGMFGGGASAPASVHSGGDAYGGMMRPSMPVQGDMNQTHNPFANNAIPQTQAPQMSSDDMQKMIDDSVGRSTRAQAMNQPGYSDYTG